MPSDFSADLPLGGTIAGNVTFQLDVRIPLGPRRATFGTVLSLFGPEMDQIGAIAKYGKRWAFGRTSDGVAGDTGIWLTPLDPVDPLAESYAYSKTWAVAYVFYTFQADGRLRIDAFYPYLDSTLGPPTPKFDWETSIEDGGWPLTNLKGEQANGGGLPFKPVRYLRLGQTPTSTFGRLDPHSKASTTDIQIKRIEIYSRALTPDETRMAVWKQVPSSALFPGMTSVEPCNTGNWLISAPERLKTLALERSEIPRGTQGPKDLVTPCGPVATGKPPARFSSNARLLAGDEVDAAAPFSVTLTNPPLGNSVLSWRNPLRDASHDPFLLSLYDETGRQLGGFTVWQTDGVYKVDLPALAANKRYQVTIEQQRVSSTQIVFETSANSNFNLDKVLTAMRTPYDGLVLLSAHRGFWKDGAENSLGALRASIDRGVESVEVDIRLSADGTLWLLHDLVIDRHTSLHGIVTSMNDRQLRGALLRDRRGKVLDSLPDDSFCGHTFGLESSRLLTLREAMLFLGCYNHQMSDGLPAPNHGIALVLDIKPPWESYNPSLTQLFALKHAIYDALAAEDHLRALGLDFPILRYMAIKVQGKELPTDPKELMRYLTGNPEGSVRDLHLVPVLYGDQKDRDIETAVFNNYRPMPWVSTLEATIPFKGSQPYTDWIATLRQENRTVTGFPSLPDYPEGAIKVWGYCCTVKNTDASNKNAPLNYGGNPDFWLDVGSNWLTGDDQPSLEALLRARGLRDLSKIMDPSTLQTMKLLAK
jgi:hypothetical protein